MENAKDILNNVEQVAKTAAIDAMELNSANFVKAETLEGIEFNNFATKEDIQNITQQIQGMEVNGKEAENTSITTFKGAFEAFEVNNLINDKNAELSFELNAASTYTPSNPANSTPGREDRQTEIEFNPHQASLAKYIKMYTGTGTAYRLSTKTAGTDNSGGKTKGGAFGRTTKSVSDQFVSYVTVGHVLTVPKEDLADTTALQAYFEEEMMEEIVDTINDQILNGDGTSTGEVQNLRGIDNWSAPLNEAGFDTLFGGLANQYGTNANEIDVFVAAKAGLKRQNFDERSGKFISFVNPELTAKIETLKSTTGEYILRTAYDPASGEMQNYLGGIMIVESSAVGADDFVLFHDSALKWVVRDGMKADIGYDTDDWSRNNVSLKAYERVALVSGKPDGIVNGSFTTAIASLNE